MFFIAAGVCTEVSEIGVWWGHREVENESERWIRKRVEGLPPRGLMFLYIPAANASK